MANDKHDLLARVTPWPWKASRDTGCRAIRGAKSGRHRQGQYRDLANTVGLSDDGEDAANAELIELAPDHALFGKAVASGRATLSVGYREDAGRRFVSVGDGLEVETFALALDAAGCPVLTAELRAALRKAVGL